MNPSRWRSMSEIRFMPKAQWPCRALAPLLFLAMLVFFDGRARASKAPPSIEETVPGALIVRFRTPRLDFPAGLLARHLGDGTYLLRAADTSEAGTGALIRQLAANEIVQWVEREHIRHRASLDAEVNDELFGQQWSLPLAQIPRAWHRTMGSAGVVIAVLDTGIRPHPDLEYLDGYDFVSDVDSAGDGDGWDADPTDPGDETDASSGLHGLHVSGIIGASTDNRIGIAGVAWHCSILPVRVLGIHGATGRDSDIATAIRWAAGLPVPGAPPNPTPAGVINMSFGAKASSNVIQEAIQAASERGVILVAAAGNDAADVAAYAPASLEHVITVGAVDDSSAPADYSNFGARIDLVAPGGGLSPVQDDGISPLDEPHGILSTGWTRGDCFTYLHKSGTSEAAAFVAGVAALMKSLDPTLDGDRARALLATTADPSRRCDRGCGGGLLDADAALATVQAECADGHCLRGDTTTLIGSRSGLSRVKNSDDTVCGGAITILGGCSVARTRIMPRSSEALLSLIAMLLPCLWIRRFRARSALRNPSYLLNSSNERRR